MSKDESYESPGNAGKTGQCPQEQEKPELEKNDLLAIYIAAISTFLPLMLAFIATLSIVYFLFIR